MRGSPDPVAERAIGAGATCFIQKPFEPKELLHELGQALLGPTQTPAEDGEASAVLRLPAT